MLLSLLWGSLLRPCLAVKENVELLLGASVALLPALYLLVADRNKLFNLFDAYNFFSGFPLGVQLFSTLVGVFAPYSASVTPMVRGMEKTDTDIRVEASFEDRPWLRNPFQSVHAVALTNIGECASGVAIVAALQDRRFRNIKGIPTKIETEYFRKGRGRMTATAVVNFGDLKGGLSKFETKITDTKGELIATCIVTWSFRDKSAAASEESEKDK
jgi:acyl-coenzyme A thioesterase PaaI-like protein